MENPRKLFVKWNRYGSLDGAREREAVGRNTARHERPRGERNVRGTLVARGTDAIDVDRTPGTLAVQVLLRIARGDERADYVVATKAWVPGWPRTSSVPGCRCGLVCDLTQQPSRTKAFDLSKSMSVITRLNSQSLETPEFRQSAV